MNFGKLTFFTVAAVGMMVGPSHATYDGWNWNNGGHHGEHCRELSEVSQSRTNLIDAEIARIRARLAGTSLTQEQQFSLRFSLRALQARKYLLLNARYQSVSDGDSEHRCEWPDGHWPHPASPWGHPWGH